MDYSAFEQWYRQFLVTAPTLGHREAAAGGWLAATTRAADICSTLSETVDDDDAWPSESMALAAERIRQGSTPSSNS